LEIYDESKSKKYQSVVHTQNRLTKNDAVSIPVVPKNGGSYKSSIPLPKTNRIINRSQASKKHTETDHASTESKFNPRNRKSNISKPIQRRVIKTFRKSDGLSKLKKESMEATKILEEISSKTYNVNQSLMGNSVFHPDGSVNIDRSHQKNGKDMENNLLQNQIFDELKLDIHNDRPSQTHSKSAENEISKLNYVDGSTPHHLYDIESNQKSCCDKDPVMETENDELYDVRKDHSPQESRKNRKHLQVITNIDLVGNEKTMFKKESDRQSLTDNCGDESKENLLESELHNKQVLNSDVSFETYENESKGMKECKDYTMQRLLLSIHECDVGNENQSLGTISNYEASADDDDYSTDDDFHSFSA